MMRKQASFLRNIATRLDLPSAVKAQVMRELASHFAEVEEELLETGIPEAQAEREAAKRLGDPADIAARLNAAHNSASWKSALLCAVPFLGSALYLLLAPSKTRLALAAVLCVLFSAASIRELIKSRRPVWLAPWLAGAMVYLLELEPSSPVTIGNSVYVTASMAIFAHGSAFAVLSLLAAWRVGVWQRPVLAYSSIVIGTGSCILLYHNVPTGPLSVVLALGAMAWVSCIVVLLVYFSRCIFEVHPYGNAVQASFFLLAVYSLSVVTSTSRSASLTASGLLCAGIATWLARTPLRRQKCYAMKAALFVHSLISPIVSGISVSLPSDEWLPVRLVAWVTGAYISAEIIYFVVSIPIRSEYRPRPDIPTIAR